MCESQVFEDVFEQRDGQFRGGGGCDGMLVGYQVGDGEVGFMAYAGDNGDGGLVDGAGEGFFVKCPEVFDTATASGEDDQVDLFCVCSAIDVIDGRGDFSGGALSLDGDGE